jgi:hypothetical protein
VAGAHPKGPSPGDTARGTLDGSAAVFLFGCRIALADALWFLDRGPGSIDKSGIGTARARGARVQVAS